jgi:hypothetical protein
MSDHLNAAKSLFDRDEVEGVLREAFYAPAGEAAGPRVAGLDGSGQRRKKKSRPKGDHYEILCISMYVEDLARLDEKVARLKQAGHRRMTRSALIRLALDRLALESVPPPSY